MIGSIGHQMAVPTNIMENLNKKLNFSTELFASPINNYFK